MPWFHEILTNMVEKHVSQEMKNIVLNGLFTSIVIASHLGYDSDEKIDSWFDYDKLVEMSHVPPKVLTEGHNKSIVRQFDIYLKRLAFQYLCLDKGKTSTKDLVDQAYKHFFQMLNKLEINKELFNLIKKQINKESLKEGLTLIIEKDINYFKMEEKLLSLETKLGILSKFYLYLAENSGRVNPVEAMSLFLGLCVLYVKNEEFQDGCIWLVDFITPYLELASPDLYGKYNIENLRIVENNTLSKLSYDINISLEPLGKYTAYNMDPSIIDAIIDEVISNKYDSHPDEDIVNFIVERISAIISSAFLNVKLYKELNNNLKLTIHQVITENSFLGVPPSLSDDLIQDILDKLTGRIKEIYGDKELGQRILDKISLKVYEMDMDKYYKKSFFPLKIYIKDLLRHVSYIVKESLVEDTKGKALIDNVTQRIMAAKFCKKELTSIINYLEAQLRSSNCSERRLKILTNKLQDLNHNIDRLTKEDFIAELRHVFKKRDYPPLSMFAESKLSDSSCTSSIENTEPATMDKLRSP